MEGRTVALQAPRTQLSSAKAPVRAAPSDPCPEKFRGNVRQVSKTSLLGRRQPTRASYWPSRGSESSLMHVRFYACPKSKSLWHHGDFHHLSERDASNGVSIATPLLPDALRNLIELVLPTPAPKHQSGRARLSDRACLNSDLFVLRSGIIWRMLPPEMNCA